MRETQETGTIVMIAEKKGPGIRLWRTIGGEDYLQEVWEWGMRD
jgi:hypothetical protein